MRQIHHFPPNFSCFSTVEKREKEWIGRQTSISLIFAQETGELLGGDSKKVLDRAQLGVRERSIEGKTGRFWSENQEDTVCCPND